MNLIIPVLTASLDLGAYAEPLRGQWLHVWINPSRAFLRQRAAAVEAFQANPSDEQTVGAFNDALMDWHARLWSQQADTSSHWSADELRTLDETDPALLAWMIRESNALLAAHRREQKKS